MKKALIVCAVCFCSANVFGGPGLPSSVPDMTDDSFPQEFVVSQISNDVVMTMTKNVNSMLNLMQSGISSIIAPDKFTDMMQQIFIEERKVTEIIIELEMLKQQEAFKREREREEQAQKEKEELKQEYAKELEQLKKEQEDAANAQRKQLEEQLKRLNERVNAEEIAREKKRVEEEEKRKLEGAFVASARREEGSFKLGSSWKYKGEIAKSGNEVRAEGKGEFKLGFLTISGVFSNNKLDLSNAIVKRPSFGVNFNVKGYFDMELIKNSTGLSKIDRTNNCLEVFMPNDCKYVFSENKIEYVDATGVISEFTTE